MAAFSDTFAMSHNLFNLTHWMMVVAIAEWVRLSVQCVANLNFL